MDDRKDRGVRADGQRQRQNGSRGEARRAAEAPQRVHGVAPAVFHNAPSPDVADVFLDPRAVSEPYRGADAYVTRDGLMAAREARLRIGLPDQPREFRERITG